MSKFFNRGVNGVLLLDKPQGLSSNRALQEARRLFRAKKAGHTGSLDPLATGVLPLCFGEATKFTQFILESDKSYLVRACLGISTDTADAEGKIIHQDNLPAFTFDDIEAAAKSFCGDYAQVPPMFSALKHQGVPLYRLARQGVEVERQSRPVSIYQLDVKSWSDPFFEFSVHVSKGTYIRSLVEDIAARLGVGAHVVELRRSQAGPFSLENAVHLDELGSIFCDQGFDGLEKKLQPIDSIVSGWPEVCISQALVDKLMNGQSVETICPVPAGMVKIFSEMQHFLGVGQSLPDGRVQPKRLVVS